MRVSGPPDCWGYRYPEHLTGPSAANYPPPPAPAAEPDRTKAEHLAESSAANRDAGATDIKSAAQPHPASGADAEPEAEAGT